MTSRSGNPSAAASTQLLDSWAWLDGVVSQTPSPLTGLDDINDISDFTADFVLGGVNGLLLDPPLFPPTAEFLNGPSPVDAFSPSQSQSQQSLLSLSPSSSTTLDAADSLQSFDMTGSFSQQQQQQGTMSDAEFQMLMGQLSPEDDVVDMSGMVSMSMSMPCHSVVVDNFALHAFAPLEQFALPMQMSVPAPVPAPAPEPAQSVRCRTCHRSFPTLCRLRKHEHTHTRPFACTVCHKGHAAKKDLHRHLWTTHPETAAEMGIPCPTRTCPKCGFECRQDNLTRHMRTKHAGESV
ncbi:hypothetical protein SEUCBS139899_007099 [Sporothrix eucalyptigena]|uniref:C2H2-type domain-containing protein n=1 Tax=Sporothrix eucalyptigena TaxID=1812306 RepID=A0ABP0CMP4_9PEZI